MGVFKRLDRNNSYTSTYNSQKKWIVRESEFDSLGIKFLNPTYFESPDYLRESINHLYYSQLNQNSSNRLYFENYLQSSLQTTDSRDYITDQLVVISIPSKVIGTHIVPKSFNIKINPDFVFTLYVQSGYIDQDFDSGIESQYVTQDQYNQTFIPIQDPDNSDSVFIVQQIQDDGEGNLVAIDQNQNKVIVGNIIYTHGIIVFTNTSVIQAINYYVQPDYINQDSAVYLQQGYIVQDFIEDAFELQWKSNLPIYTKNYICKVKNTELNHTLNRTAFDIDSPQIAQNIDQVSFTPYFTTIGLYNDVNQLIAVAKTSQPIPKSKFTNMTINVNLDMPFGVDGKLQQFEKDNYLVDS